MKINTDKEKIDALLTRGVDEVIDKKDLEQKLLSGKQLKIKLGSDPTSPNLHIGRSIPLLKLRDFQELGHKIIFIIGDFTGTIGDTSDKDSERPMLDEKVINENLKTYIKQAGKIIDIEKSEIRHNSEWLDKLKYKEISYQANQFSLNEFISRENIKKRLDAGKRVSLRELLYPLMQGYDSVAIEADVEVGGTDQRFNILSGRALQRHYKQEPQNIITNPLIEGLDGRKMSSSWGNTVNLLDTPNNMYGKTMSLNDDFIIKYFVLLTRVSPALIETYEQEIKSGANPRDYKMKLAYELVQFYHSQKDAKQAQNFFIQTFSRKEIPTDIPEIQPTTYNVMTALLESKCVKSKTEARRVIEQKGVKLNSEVVVDVEQKIKSGDIIQKGKRTFIKIQ
ncbi:tyrosine--tRNA ligase [Patescibacteria group bacterium]|nr:tyrosine--tRNA ligase [Patescibacteria group bacterium]MBU1956177.1 tyrosine--tRNA ligase [Patescibacteria group bacterium]